MTPEIIIVVIAVFVSGGALGAAGTLLAQWVLKKIQGETLMPTALGAGDLELLRGDVGELGKRLHMIDVRLDFTEQLLGGALPLSRLTEEAMVPPEEPRDEPEEKVALEGGHVDSEETSSE